MGGIRGYGCPSLAENSPVRSGTFSLPMKIRTESQLLDKISEDRVWRIRELSSLRSQCSRVDLPDNARNALRRSFVPMAYAHWEGFVKKSSHYYLEFIAMQGLLLGELSPPIMSLHLWAECAKTIARNKPFSLVDVCEFVLNRSGERVRIRYEKVMPSGANVDSRTLRDICSILGLPFGIFETKTLFIDATLVGRRNHIAHGELQEISER